MVDSVSIDSARKIVEIHVSHNKGAKLPFPECRRDCMVYDHLRERMWRDLDSIGFKKIINARPQRIQCPVHGIRGTFMPLSERRSRFTLRFESRSIRVLQNMDIYNFTQIMDISWCQAWNIIHHAVKRGMSKRTSHPRIIGIDDKSNRKGYMYITIVMDMWNPYISSTLEHMPGADGKIVFDRFHLMYQGNEAVDSVRKDENRDLAKRESWT